MTHGDNCLGLLLILLECPALSKPGEDWSLQVVELVARILLHLKDEVSDLVKVLGNCDSSTSTMTRNLLGEGLRNKCISYSHAAIN